VPSQVKGSPVTRVSLSDDPGRGIVVAVLDHVTIRVADRSASEAFYTTVLRSLGVEPTYSEDDLVEWENDFSLAAADAAHPVTRGLHLAWFAPTREEVHAFWQAGIDAGHRDDGAPGPRPEYGPDYYGGFLLDPDGNSAEAVTLDHTKARGAFDHLWIRVEDVAAAKRFYETIAPHAGIRLANDAPELARFRYEDGSFSLVAGTPTENVHLAFAAPDDATVDAFHRAALDAGYRDHGAPGERPEYHAGYYGAYVLDPDGNNVEAVNHNR
jgi:catechol 2,3-dioxygenase-like lactoylglutathione lyase family enzyme